MISISIHVPAKGTTKVAEVIAYGTVYFNPRSREGNDAPTIYKVLNLWNISIHVPAKGTTFMLAHTLPNHLDFNPRSREGNDERIF